MGIQGNRAFLEMLKSAKERLTGKTAEEISANTSIRYDKEEEAFFVSCLGQELRISYPEYEITPKIDEWQHLTILHYMDMADGTPVSPQIIPFGELPGGLIWGGGFDHQCEVTVSRSIANRPEEVVRKACEQLGAGIVTSNADLCAVFPYLPLYPVTLKVWFADEELDGTGRMFLNGNADHYLSVEDAVTVGAVIIEKLMANLA